MLPVVTANKQAKTNNKQTNKLPDMPGIEAERAEQLYQTVPHATFK